jgi:hypothetical protein
MYIFHIFKHLFFDTTKKLKNTNAILKLLLVLIKLLQQAEISTQLKVKKHYFKITARINKIIPTS